MDFELNEEQTMLRDTAHDVLTKFYDIEKLREVTATDLGWSRDVWKSLAEIGILCAPGEFYGPNGAQYVRIGLTATDQQIEAAATRIAEAFGADSR